MRSKDEQAQPTPNRFGLPNLGLGLGLRGEHIATILRDEPAVGWFEIISENFLIGRGWLRWALDAIRERYPVVMHGVSLSIGSSDPLDRAHLRDLKALADAIDAPWVSDHVCWTGVGGRNSHDLLPVPYNEAMLAWMSERVRLVQDALERPLILENPSSYLEFASSTMTEWEFIGELCRRSGCGLLLDVNNIWVSGHNHGYEPSRYLDAVPWDHVVQFHVAGHTDRGDHILDSHIGPVTEPVWQLLGDAWGRCGPRSMMLEWDAEIPSFERTWAEAQLAWNYVDAAHSSGQGGGVKGSFAASSGLAAAQADPGILAEQRWMHGVIAADKDADRGRIAAVVLPNATMTAQARVDVYTEALRARFVEAMAIDFATVVQELGAAAFTDVVQAFCAEHPSTSPYLELLGAGFAGFLHRRAGEVAIDRRTNVAADERWSPWLADAARLEWAAASAAIAPRFEPLSAQELAAVPAEKRAQIRLQSSPGVGVLSLDHAVHERVASGGAIGAGPQQVLVFRRALQVQMRVVEPDEAAVLTAMIDGATLQDAVMGAVAERPQAADAIVAALPDWTHRWAADHLFERVSY